MKLWKWALSNYGSALAIWFSGIAACAPAEPVRVPQASGAASGAAPPSLAESEPLAGAPLLPVGSDGVRVRGRFSDIVVRETGSVRSLYFVDDANKEHLESRLDVARPQWLIVPYTRSMFASYLFVPEPKRVLIVGVGAGSMVRFLEHHDPRVQLEGVEIDPAVLRLARDYFGTRPSETTQLIVADGFDYIEETTQHYDVIYLDAFLKPLEDETRRPKGGLDASGVPQRLKTVETYQRMQSKLTESGVVVINLHYATVKQDVETLRQVFAGLYLFDVPNTGNRILVGTRKSLRMNAKSLRERGRQADKRLRAPFSFAEIASQWQGLPASRF